MLVKFLMIYLHNRTNISVICSKLTRLQRTQQKELLSSLHISLIFDSNWKISVKLGTLLYVFGSCDHHFKLKNTDVHPLRPVLKEDTLIVDVSINGAADRNGPIKLLDTWKVTPQNLLYQKSMNSCHKRYTGFKHGIQTPPSPPPQNSLVI